MAQSYDLVELYAGRARITRLGRTAGFTCIAADVIYDESATRQKSSLNLCGNAGFALLPLISS